MGSAIRVGPVGNELWSASVKLFTVNACCQLIRRIIGLAGMLLYFDSDQDGNGFVSRNTKPFG